MKKQETVMSVKMSADACPKPYLSMYVDRMLARLEAEKKLAELCKTYPEVNKIIIEKHGAATIIGIVLGAIAIVAVQLLYHFIKWLW